MRVAFTGHVLGNDRRGAFCLDQDDLVQIMYELVSAGVLHDPVTVTLNDGAPVSGELNVVMGADTPDQLMIGGVDILEMMCFANTGKSQQLVFEDEDKGDELTPQLAMAFAQTHATVTDEDGTVTEIDFESLKEAADRNFVYWEIKRKLVAKGVPVQEIAFIHEATTKLRRSQLFADMRSGRVRVLIGSTQRMGAGMNVQERLFALHHLTAPWRPCDVEQANGRVLRPGNRFPEVYVRAHITRGTFDGYIWQTIERKAAFINQFMAGDLRDIARRADDIGSTQLSATELKALASGNPRVMQKVALEQEETRLLRINRSWRDDVHRAKREVQRKTEQLQDASMTVRQLEAGKLVLDANPGDLFALDVLTAQGITIHNKREDAGKHLREIVTAWKEEQERPLAGAIAAENQHKKQGPTPKAKAEGDIEVAKQLIRDAWEIKDQRAALKLLTNEYTEQVVGMFRGMELVIRCRWATWGLHSDVLLIRVPGTADAAAHTDALHNDKGVVMGIESGLRQIATRLENLNAGVTVHQSEIANFKEFIDAPWEHVASLERCQLALQIVDIDLSEESDDVKERRRSAVLTEAEERDYDLSNLFDDHEVADAYAEPAFAKAVLPLLPGAVVLDMPTELAKVPEVEAPEVIEMPPAVIEMPEPMPVARPAPRTAEDALDMATRRKGAASVGQTLRFVKTGSLTGKAKPKSVPTNVDDQANQFMLDF